MGSYVFRVLVSVLVLEYAAAQFANLFAGMMNPGNAKTGNGSACATASVSCMPWCNRGTGSDGCPTCQCSSGGTQSGPNQLTAMNPMNGMNSMGAMNPMGGLNPMSGNNPIRGGNNPMSGMNPMSGGMNPMFSALTGGKSPMMGPMQPAPKACPPTPTTCQFPQPWCQRIVGADSCVKCICGSDLKAYIQALNGQTIPPTAQPVSTLKPTTQRPSDPSRVVAPTTTHAPSVLPHVTSCIADFYCTKMCNHGYRTDNSGCPLCECIPGELIDTPVDATDPPGKHAPPTVLLVTEPAPVHVTDDVTSCPGIFNCATICDSGYKTDASGCPICECVV